MIFFLNLVKSLYILYKIGKLNLFVFLYLFDFKEVFKKNYIKILFILLLSVFIFWVYHFFGERIIEIFNGSDKSFNFRLAIPVLVVYAVLQQHPIFGVGIGGKESMLEIFNDIAISFGYNPSLMKFH